MFGLFSKSDQDINDMVLELINQKDLNSNDIADVIAEQISIAKNSDNYEVSRIAKKLEKRFGSKYQQENSTLNYNEKADDFGGYFMSILMKASSLAGGKGIASCLSVLEQAYDFKKKQEDNVKNDNGVKKMQTVITSPFEPTLELQSEEDFHNYILKISKLTHSDLCIELSNILSSRYNIMSLPSGIGTVFENQKIVTDLTDRLLMVCILKFGQPTIMNYCGGDLRVFNNLVKKIDDEVAQQNLEPYQHGSMVLNKLSVELEVKV